MATHSSIFAWKIPMDRGTWWATVHRVAKSRTRLKRLTTALQIATKKSQPHDSNLNTLKRKEFALLRAGSLDFLNLRGPKFYRPTFRTNSL